MRTKNELFYQRSYFAEAQWIDVLGDSTYCIWKKLITHVDRSPDAISKYGNRNTIPFSLTRLAENLGMTVNTLKKHARKLWNYGLIDFVEWSACYKLGKKPLNIVVYNYPQNDTSTAAQHLKMVRDYDAQYESGAYVTYVKEKSAEIYAVQVAEATEEPTPFVIPEPIFVEPQDEIIYDLSEIYLLFDDTTGQFVDESNRQASDSMNSQYVDGSNGHETDEHKYITNAFLNKSNAELNKSNTVNKSNAFNNSSSSMVNHSKELNSEEDKFKIEVNTPVKIDFEMIKSVLQVALEVRHVAPSLIKKIIKLAKELQLPYVTVELVHEQLDRMAKEKESGKTIYDFGKYFVNGLTMLIESMDFYGANSYSDIIKRKSEKAQAKINASQKVFYNWLEEREGVQYA